MQELGFLREDIESEVSKLESIHDRLHMWPPAEDVASPAHSAPQATPGAPIFIVHGSDTMRAEAIARAVERATRRDTIILREQANLGQTTARPGGRTFVNRAGSAAASGSDGRGADARW